MLFSFVVSWRLLMLGSPFTSRWLSRSGLSTMRDFPNTVAVVDHHSIIPGMAHRTKVCGKMRQPDLVFDVDVTAWLKIGSALQVENGIRYHVHWINQDSPARKILLIDLVCLIPDTVFNLTGRPNFQPSRYVNVEHQIWLSHFPANLSAMGHSWTSDVISIYFHRFKIWSEVSFYSCDDIVAWAATDFSWEFPLQKSSKWTFQQ